MKRQKIRKAKALAAANRRPHLGLAIGTAVGVALVAVGFFVVPIGSPARMLRAQVVHGTPVGLEAETNGTAVIASITEPAPPDTPSTNPDSATPGAAATPIAHPAYLAISFEKLSGFPFVVTDQLLDRSEERRVGK